jgi:hypothetical protein
MHGLLRALRFALGLYRCFVCQRWRLFHTLRGIERCDNTPLPITITEAGLERVAGLERCGDDGAAGKLLERQAR